MGMVSGLLQCVTRCVIGFLCALAITLPQIVLSDETGNQIHFVFDLDDTLIRWIRPDEKLGGEVIPKSGTINGYKYRVMDGASEILGSLLQDYPGAKISFFSAGPRNRNLQILQQLRLPDGRAALEIAYKVLSEEELTTVGKNRYKDLRLVVDGGGLNNLVLFDDKPSIILPGQEKNVLWIGDKPEFHQVKLDEGRQSVRQFLQNRNKLVRARGVVEAAIEKAKQAKISLSEALWILQEGRLNTEGQILRETSTLYDISFYRRGIRSFAKVNSGYRFTTALPGRIKPGCIRRQLKALLNKPAIKII